MTRITNGLAWLATEAVAFLEVVAEAVVLMDMGSFQRKKHRRALGKSAGHFRVQRYPRGRPIACLAQFGNRLSQKGHHDQVAG
jgi:hypothetical protein